MQQNYARMTGVVDTLAVESLLEDALRLTEPGMVRAGILVVREFEPVPPVEVDRHKVLQILVNLLRNARQAIDGSTLPKRMVQVRIRCDNGPQVLVQVQDSGLGIAPENLTRIFSHGFTTKKDGHGFGLHSGALAAAEMGGSLTVQSEGHGRGATFTLRLPLKPDRASATMLGKQA
jgi:signal transduction histidine kinase